MDDKGNILKAWAVTRDHTSDPVAITLQAIRYAQIVANNTGWKLIQIRFDMPALVNQLKQSQEFAVNTSTLVKDIRLLAYLFEYFDIISVPKKSGCWQY